MASLSRREFGLAGAAIAAGAGMAPGSDDNDRQAFGQRLLHARQAKGWSVEQCCRNMSTAQAEEPGRWGNDLVEPNDWQAWESGQAMPNMPQGLLAAKLLSVNVRWLTFGTAA